MQKTDEVSSQVAGSGDKTTTCQHICTDTRMAETSQPGLFRKMRYIPATLDDDGIDAVSLKIPSRGIDSGTDHQQSKSIVRAPSGTLLAQVDRDAEMPTLSMAILRPLTPERKEVSSADSRKPPELFPTSKPEIRRSFGLTHGRSSSPAGRKMLKSPTASPRRSLSPRRGIVGKVLAEPPAGVFSRSGKFSETSARAEGDPSANKEPAGAFRRRKNPDFKPSIALLPPEDIENEFDGSECAPIAAVAPGAQALPTLSSGDPAST